MKLVLLAVMLLSAGTVTARESTFITLNDGTRYKGCWQQSPQYLRYMQHKFHFKYIYSWDSPDGYYRFYTPPAKPFPLSLLGDEQSRMVKRVVEGEIACYTSPGVAGPREPVFTTRYFSYNLNGGQSKIFSLSRDKDILKNILLLHPESAAVYRKKDGMLKKYLTHTGAGVGTALLFGLLPLDNTVKYSGVGIGLAYTCISAWTITYTDKILTIKSIIEYNKLFEETNKPTDILD